MKLLPGSTRTLSIRGPGICTPLSCPAAVPSRGSPSRYNFGTEPSSVTAVGVVHLHVCMSPSLIFFDLKNSVEATDAEDLFEPNASLASAPVDSR